MLRPSAVVSLSTVSLLGWENQRELEGRGQNPVLVLLFRGNPPPNSGVKRSRRPVAQGVGGWEVRAKQGPDWFLSRRKWKPGQIKSL